jgi:predicted DNA-binding transcriptional regulator YafY
MSKNNIDRPLRLALRLLNGEQIQQRDWMTENDITERSAQRDAKEVRTALADVHFPAELNVTFSDSPLYHITNGGAFDEQSVYLITKVLRGSRVLPKDELIHVVNGLIAKLDPHMQKTMKKRLSRSLDDYRSTARGHEMLAGAWQMSKYIADKQVINFQTIERVVMKGVPHQLFFDDLYIWVAIQDAETNLTTTYRLNELSGIFPVFTVDDASLPVSHQVLDQKPAKLEVSKDANLIVDHFPSSVVEQHDSTKTIVYVNQYDYHQLKQYILGQGPNIMVLSPESLKNDIKETITQMSDLYE